MSHLLADELRAAVLKAAIKGELTEHNDIEQSFCFSLESSFDENERFSLPDSWHWYLLKDVMSIKTGKKDQNYATDDGKYNFYTCAKEVFKAPAYSFEGESLILPGNGANVGEVTLYNGKFEAYQRTYVLQPLFAELNVKYMYYVFLENWKKYNSDKMYGSAIPYIKLGNLSNFPIPIPPQPEQARIVARVEEIMAKIDEYEKLENKLAELKKKFPEEMKASILQAAMEGKLDSYDETDHMPSFNPVLPKQEPFNEECFPFALPSNWEWVHLNQIAETSLGKTLNGSKDIGTELPYLCSINIQWDNIVLDKVKTARFTDKDIEKYSLKEGDLLICEGGDTGRAAIWESDKEMFYQNALHRIRFNQGCDSRFYYWVFYYYKRLGLIDNYSKGQTIKHLVQSALYSIPFPLPPIEEQQRIVDKLDKLLPLCDELAELA